MAQGCRLRVVPVRADRAVKASVPALAALRRRAAPVSEAPAKVVLDKADLGRVSRVAPLPEVPALAAALRVDSPAGPREDRKAALKGCGLKKPRRS